MATETREKILDAASRLFAASDSRGASLRAIAREAGVNSALIHYHFGSREGLFEAAILRALTPIQDRRSQMITSLQQPGTPLSPHDLARLFVEPLLPPHGEPSPLEAVELRLLSRAFTDQRALLTNLTVKHFSEVMHAFGELLGEALPNLPESIKSQRMRFCVQSALESMSGAEIDLINGDASARKRLIAELINFLAGGLGAPTDNE
jgi:AcrR family transcriptional regulator